MHFVKSKGLVSLLLTVMIAATGCSSSKPADKNSAGEKSSQIETVEIKAAGWRASSAPYTLSNLEKAAENLNKKLEQENSKYRIKVNTISKPTSESLNQFITFSSKSGDAPDIFEVGYTNIGWLANSGYILPLDGIEKEIVFKNMMPGYWNAVTWDKQIWGVIQDTEARPVFYNKDVLKKMGWTDQQLAELPKKVETGEFTLEDMTKLAKQAVDQKLVTYGFMHHTGERDLAMLFLNQGTQLYDAEKKQYVLDKANVLATFQSLKQMVDQKVLPSSMMSISTDDRLKSMVNGTSLFMGGGIWEEAKWRQQDLHKEMGKVSGEWIQQHIGVMLLPPSKKGGKPVTVSGPYTYVISKNTKKPELAKRLLVAVSAPEFQKEHAVQSSHIPFTSEGQELIKDNAWLNTVKYMTQYSQFVPNHPDEPKFEKIYKDAIRNVETGEMQPEQAVQWMEQQMKLDLGNITVK
jgi:inositol-phosphate transport system substrate-binding protein